MGANQSTSLCANENGVCSWPANVGPQNIIYSANNKAHFRDIQGNSVECNNANFGDPSPGAQKACYRRNIPTYTLSDGIPQGFTKCADENKNCQVSYNADILYGADGSYVSGLIKPNQSINCSNEVFGDPKEDADKSCYVREINAQNVWAPIGAALAPIGMSINSALQNNQRINGQPNIQMNQPTPNQPLGQRISNALAPIEQRINNAITPNANQPTSNQPLGQRISNALAPVGQRINNTNQPINQRVDNAINSNQNRLNSNPFTKPSAIPQINQRANPLPNQPFAKQPVAQQPIRQNSNNQMFNNNQILNNNQMFNNNQIPNVNQMQNDMFLRTRNDQGDNGLFYGWNNINLPGFDLKDMPIEVDNEQECAVKCLDNSCNLYSYDTVTDQCWLKKVPAKDNYTTRVNITNNF